MPELTHDTADDGFHEIQLSGKQLVFLFMAGTVLAVVVFLCGVQVGRGVKSDRPAETGEPLAMASPSAPPVSTPAAAEGGPPAAEPPAPAKDDDELSYAKRLQSDNAPAEKLKPQPATAAPRPAAPAASVPAGTGAAAPPKAAPAPSPQAAGKPGVWVLQLIALKDRAAAASIVQRLVAKGYPAFLVSPSPGEPSIFRVQVGRYNDRSEAEQVKRRLEKEEQYKPWISH